MDLQVTAEKLFPDCTFEGQIVGDEDIAVLGLARAMTPQNCEVLASGEFQYALHQAVHRTYLVKADHHLLQVRMFFDAPLGICARITLQRSGVPYVPGVA